MGMILQLLLILAVADRGLSAGEAVQGQRWGHEGRRASDHRGSGSQVQPRNAAQQVLYMHDDQKPERPEVQIVGPASSKETSQQGVPEGVGDLMTVENKT